MSKLVSPHGASQLRPLLLEGDAVNSTYDRNHTKWTCFKRKQVNLVDKAMRRRAAIFGFALTIGAAAASPAWAQQPGWLDEARKVATSVPPKLVAVLIEEIDKGGPESAIAVCKDKAPLLAKAAADESGWSVRRVSLRNRNPRAVPDAWERSALEDFDRRAAAGESPATLEKAELVQENGVGVRRYIRALPAQQLCLQCHGSTEQLKPAVVERLRALYPDDKATGYAVGQIRGAMTIRRPQ